MKDPTYLKPLKMWSDTKKFGWAVVEKVYHNQRQSAVKMCHTNAFTGHFIRYTVLVPKYDFQLLVLVFMCWELYKFPHSRFLNSVVIFLCGRNRLVFLHSKLIFISWENELIYAIFEQKILDLPERFYASLIFKGQKLKF